MGTDQDSVTYTAHLDMQGIVTVTGSWAQGHKPTWKINPVLAESYRNEMRDILEMSWHEIGGNHTPHELGAMIACLEVTSTKLAMRLVIPDATQEKMLSLSALAS